MLQKIKYKTNRVKTLKSFVGFREALRFEWNWTLHKSELKVRVPGYPRPFRVRRGTSDIMVLCGAFSDAELAAVELRNPRLIIDGGANVGFTTAWLARHHPSATVVAVEPFPENCQRLRWHTSDYENVVVIDGALWHSKTSLEINDPSVQSWSIQCREPGDRVHESVRVESFTVEELIDRYGDDRCDLLNLDIEGAEVDLLEHGTRWLGRVDAILVELHGQEAWRSMERACPSDTFDRVDHREKVMLTRRQR